MICCSQRVEFKFFILIFKVLCHLAANCISSLILILTLNTTIPTKCFYQLFSQISLSNLHTFCALCFIYPTENISIFFFSAYVNPTYSSKCNYSFFIFYKVFLGGRETKQNKTKGSSLNILMPILLY